MVRKLTGAGRVAAAVLAFAGAAWSIDQAGATALATYAVTRAGLGGGVVSLPRCGTGELAVAFVQNSRLVVHATATADGDVAAMQSLVESTGALGRRAYVEKGTALSLPFADNFVDLLVVAGLTDATLAQVSASEVQRVLRPGGLALVGRAVSEGAGLTQPAVQTWLGGLANAAAETNAQGVWAVVNKARAAGSDDWTHHWRGPDNNPRSLDANAGYPYLPQWRGKPYNAGRNGTVVAAGGRLYSFIVDKFSWDILRTLRAFRTANGQSLWNRNMEDFGIPHEMDPRVLDAGLGHFYFPNADNNSFLIADENGVYVCGTTRVYYLNGETGATTRTISLGGDSAAIWMAKSGDTLYALVASGGFFSNTGRRIAAHNATTGALIWQHVEPVAIHKGDLGMQGGRVFFYAAGSRMACISAATGTQVWENRDAALLSALGSGTPHLSATGPALVCSPQGIFVSRSTNEVMVALSPTTGQTLWPSLSRTNGFTFWSMNDTLMYCRYPWSGVEINIRNGTSANSRANLGDGCGPFTLAPRAMFTQNGGLTYSFAGGFAVGSLGRKSDCMVPPVIENGIWVTPNTACTCYPLVRGMFADAPSGAFAFDQTAVVAQRLEQGPAFGGIDAVVTADNLDWPSHRANNSRAAVSAAVLFPSPHLRWTRRAQYPYADAAAADPLHWGTYSPYAEHGPTPPVVVGDRVYWGGSDGVIRCNNTNSNTEEWRYTTGGKMFTAPSVANGCVYAGSSDGYAYCIEAHTGRLVWRFRGAPADRRINLYGHLSSTWPVLTGVLVQGTTAFFTAGFTPETGVHVYALDALTGSIVWQNNTAGISQGQRTGSSPGRYVSGLMPGGGMTVVGNRLWVRSYLNSNAVFDLATGARQPLPSALDGGMDIYLTVRGREVGALDATHVVFGGRPLFADNNERGAMAGRLAMRYMRADADGDPMYCETQFSEQSLSAGAWDNSRVYACLLDAGSPLACWNKSDLTSRIDAAQAGSSVTNPFFTSSAAPSAVWGRSDIYAEAVAVASNGVAAVYSKSMPSDTRLDGQSWYVGMLNSASGANTWEVQLPSQPVYNGLAVSRTGDLVVTLVNGDVVCYGEAPVSVAGRSAPALVQGSDERSLISRASSTTWSPLPSAGVPASAVPQAPPAPTSAVAAQRAQVHAGATAVTPWPVAGERAVQMAAEGAVPRQSAEQPFALLEATVPGIAHVNRDMRWRSDALCVGVESVGASESGGSSLPAATTDRDLRTRWTPAAAQSWIVYDLGRPATVSSVELVWYAPRSGSASFTVELSMDGTRFEIVDSGRLEGRGTSTALRTFVPGEARYVRIGISMPEQGTAVSLYEVGIHGIAPKRLSAR